MSELTEKIGKIIGAVCVILILATVFVIDDKTAGVIAICSIVAVWAISSSTITTIEQGESVLRVLLAVFLGILICILLSIIPVIGWIIGPLFAGFVAGAIAGFRTGWDVLPTYYTTGIYASLVFGLGMTTTAVTSLFGFLDDFAGIVSGAGLLAFFGILILCGIIWIYLVILCGIGALIGCFFHSPPEI